MSEVAEKYASVLFDSASDKGAVDAVTEDVLSLLAALRGSNELRLALKNPVIRNEVKLSVLKEIFAGKVTDDFTQFLDFLSRKNRIAIAENIAESYLEIKDEREGIVTVALTTAVDFGDELIADLKERFESVLSKKVRFTFRKDEAIIGGFVAKVQDTVYDASIAHQLELLKKKFTESALTGNS